MEQVEGESEADMKPVKAWACVGSNGHIFVTDWSPHAPCVGRLQVYLRRADALLNDRRAVRVEIREVPARKGVARDNVG